MWENLTSCPYRNIFLGIFPLGHESFAGDLAFCLDTLVAAFDSLQIAQD